MNNLYNEHPLVIKSHILCQGLKKNEFSSELAQVFDPTRTKRTGNVGVHLRIGEYIVNAVMDGIYVSSAIYSNNSPYEIRKSGTDDSSLWVVCRNGREVAEAILITPPPWYDCKTSSGIPMTQILLSEGELNLMGCINDNCYYLRHEVQCKFCGMKKSGVEYQPCDFEEVVIEALRFNQNTTLTLTCGNTNDVDRGAGSLTNYIRNINQRIHMAFTDLHPSIQVECAPPAHIEYLSSLIAAGVGSFSINLEIFNENLRKTICPGKSRITRANYESSWKCIVDKLGRYKVASALIVGLEPPESTLAGVVHLLEQGVLPNLLPFRPIPGSLFENKKTIDPMQYFDICHETSTLFDKYNVNRNMRLGCTTCRACSMELDLFEKI